MKGNKVKTINRSLLVAAAILFSGIVPAYGWNCSTPGQVRVQVPNGTMGSGTGDGSGQVVVDNGLTFECETLPTSDPSTTSNINKNFNKVTDTANSSATGGSATGQAVNVSGIENSVPINSPTSSSTSSTGASTSGVTGSGNSKASATGGAGGSSSSTGVAGPSVSGISEGDNLSTLSPTSSSTSAGGSVSGSGNSSLKNSGNSTATLKNSGDSSNTNIVAPTNNVSVDTRGTVGNVAGGSASQNQKQSQSVTSSGNQTGNSSATGNGDTSDSNNTYVPRQTASAVAPPIFNTSPCTRGFSLAGQGPMAGASFGATKSDKGCEDRATAVLFFQFGNVSAAARILCQTASAKRAHLSPEDCAAMVTPSAPVTEVRPDPPAQAVQPIIVNVPAQPAPIVQVMAAPVAPADPLVSAAAKVHHSRPVPPCGKVITNDTIKAATPGQ